MPKLIQVFEHQWLPIENSRHFEQLVRFNEQHGNQYFTVGLRRICFSSYVGVIQVGDLTIEILPKADRSSGDTTIWQHNLLDMLRVARGLRLERLSEANLHQRRQRLLDIYLENFLQAVDRLKHEGLSKKYRPEAENGSVWRGRLLWPKQLAQNSTHQERCFTERTRYDANHLHNQLLKAALRAVVSVAPNPGQCANARRQLLHLETIADLPQVNQQHFDRLTFDRKTERYRPALLLARMILLHYSPDVRQGNAPVLALLFDMNRLFEAYIAKRLQWAAAQPEFSQWNLRIEPHPYLPFWENKTLCPDLLISFLPPDAPQNPEDSDHYRQRIIVDTKWKLPKNNQPDDADLRQMFAYNLRFGARQSILLYPNTGHPDKKTTPFQQHETPVWQLPVSHGCALRFVEVFSSDGRLNDDFASALLLDLLQGTTR